jgi:MFS family permease
MARQRKLHYAWIVAGVTFLTLLVAAGLRATPGVLIVPLETEFGWSRATISFAIGLNIFLYGLIGPFAAAMMDRFGLRRMMLAALVCIASGVALTPLMTRPWQLIVLWGLGSAPEAEPPPWCSARPSWRAGSPPGVGWSSAC